MLEFLTQNEKNSIKFEEFKKEHNLIVTSFDTNIKKYNMNQSIGQFTFASLGSYIKSYSKKHRTYEIACPFFHNGEDCGIANIVIVMEPNIKILEKLYEQKLRIIGVYFEDNEMGCIYQNKKGNLDYFVEKALIEMVSIKDVTVDLSLLKI